MEKEFNFEKPESEEFEKEKSLKNIIIEKAIAQYGEIFPVKGKETLDACFTAEAGNLIFWFNTKDDSTHVITQKL